MHQYLKKKYGLGNEEMGFWKSDKPMKCNIGVNFTFNFHYAVIIFSLRREQSMLQIPFCLNLNMLQAARNIFHKGQHQLFCYTEFKAFKTLSLREDSNLTHVPNIDHVLKHCEMCRKTDPEYFCLCYLQLGVD